MAALGGARCLGFALLPLAMLALLLALRLGQHGLPAWPHGLPTWPHAGPLLLPPERPPAIPPGQHSCLLRAAGKCAPTAHPSRFVPSFAVSSTAAPGAPAAGAAVSSIEGARLLAGREYFVNITVVTPEGGRHTHRGGVCLKLLIQSALGPAAASSFYAHSDGVYVAGWSVPEAGSFSLSVSLVQLCSNADPFLDEFAPKCLDAPVAASPYHFEAIRPEGEAAPDSPRNVSQRCFAGVLPRNAGGGWHALPQWQCRPGMCSGSGHTLLTPRVFRPPNCHYHLFTQEDLVACVQSRRIVLLGDSSMQETYAFMEFLLGVPSLPLPPALQASLPDSLARRLAAALPAAAARHPMSVSRLSRLIVPTLAHAAPPAAPGEVTFHFIGAPTLEGNKVGVLSVLVGDLHDDVHAYLLSVPDLVVLTSGLHDIANPEYSLPWFRKHFMAALSFIRSVYHGPLIWRSSTALSDPFRCSDWNDRIVELNSLVESLLPQFNATFLDVFDATFSHNTNMDYSDSVHYGMIFTSKDVNMTFPLRTGYVGHMVAHMTLNAMCQVEG